MRVLTALFIIACVAFAATGKTASGGRNCVTRSGDVVTGGLYPVPSDCSKYFHCWQGLLYVTHCGDGKSFDKQLKECRPQEQVQC